MWDQCSEYNSTPDGDWSYVSPRSIVFRFRAVLIFCFLFFIKGLGWCFKNMTICILQTTWSAAEMHINSYKLLMSEVCIAKENAFMQSSSISSNWYNNMKWIYNSSSDLCSFRRLNITSHFGTWRGSNFCQFPTLTADLWPSPWGGGFGGCCRSREAGTWQSCRQEPFHPLKM